MNPEKSVFISYRRTNVYTARAVHHYLTRAGFDVLLDTPEDNTSPLLLEQIAHRTHFLVLLTPSALERCANPDDYLRRHIEYAMESKRLIVPLVFDGFEFNRIRHYLTGKLSILPNFSWLRVNEDFFDEAMVRLVQRYLIAPREVTKYMPEEPTRLPSQRYDYEVPTLAQLKSERFFESGFRKLEDIDYEGAIRDFTDALEQNALYAEAFYQRGRVYAGMGNTPKAIEDWEQAIEIEPEDSRVHIILSSILRERREYVKALASAFEGVKQNPGYYEAYYQRGNIYQLRKYFENAISDYTEAIRLNPKFAMAYTNRGNAYVNTGAFENAISDYNEALRLNPRAANTYNNRGLARVQKGDLNGALDDFDEAVNINPEYEYAFYNRAEALEQKGDAESLRGAIADFRRYLDLGGGQRDGDQADVEARIETLKTRINELTSATTE
jgi:tetratricopeptide (TPR) repeat protein